jgi:hypothetical protein
MDLTFDELLIIRRGITQVKERMVSDRYEYMKEKEPLPSWLGSKHLNAVLELEERMEDEIERRLMAEKAELERIEQLRRRKHKGFRNTGENT